MARSAELLSDAPEDFLGESRILHGASQHHAADHRRCPKDGFFSGRLFSQKDGGATGAPLGAPLLRG